MKAIKNLFAVLIAASLAFSFTACSDDPDDDEETLTLNFSYDNTSGKYLSDEITRTDEEGEYSIQFYVTLNENSSEWEFGVYDEGYLDKEFKGTYTKSGSKVTLTKTHFYGFDLTQETETEAWIASKAENWKSFTIASDNTFSVTIKESDYADMEKNYEDAAKKYGWEDYE